MNVWLVLVHWLHVLGAIVWFGGMIIGYLVLWPALLRRPPADALATFKAIERPMSMTMGGAAQVVFWLGIIRGTAFGPIKSFGDLTASPYGHTFLTAIVLTVGLAVFGAISTRRFVERVWDGNAFRPDAASYLRRSGAISLILLAILLGLMVLMRFGL